MKKTLNDIGKDNLEKVLIKGEKLQIVIMGSSTVALVCAVESTANLGMVFFENEESGGKNIPDNTGRLYRLRGHC
nr:hypothetical protein [Methanobacterium formicicum]